MFDPDAEKLVYEMEDWTADEQSVFCDLLGRRGIPYKFDAAGDLVVGAVDEEAADSALDAFLAEAKERKEMGETADLGAWEDWDDPNPPFEAASWWTRGKAALIDGLIFIAAWLVYATMNTIGMITGTKTLMGVATLVGLGTLVWAGWLFGYRQGVTGTTPGKRRLGIHLVDAVSGEVPGWPKGVGRWLVPGLVGGIQGIGNIVQLIDYLWPLWDPKKQRLTDKAFGTRVVVGTPN